MKKVININFQGRVIPIEETAYEILQQYITSLRAYFANEEGRDEIINDIEGRIAELFSDRLKKGATCITDEDVNAVIASMGRPEDFEKAEEAPNGARTQTTSQQAQSSSTAASYRPVARGRLYRNADDKIIAGVCSGLANYLGIDPVIVRILFVLFFGALFWVYIVLWIFVPSQSAQSNITKRLYRSADDRVIAGVCGGLSAYFNISSWIPRLIFALPIIIGLISGPFNMWFSGWDFWWGPRIVTNSLSFTLFVTYVVLWIAVPVAQTSSEKLEMRGERVDLNSIRNTVKEDIESFKAKAQNFGNELKQTAQELGDRAKVVGQTAGAHAKSFTAEAGPAARKTGNGIGQVIGILFKAFFLFIAGVIAIALFGLLMGLLFGGFVVFPFKDFVLDGFWQNALAWSSLILFLAVPIVALITWLIRRIMGVRSRNHYLGYAFGGLWTIGLISVIILMGLLAKNFKTGSEKVEAVNSLVQPSKGKLFVDVASSNVRYYGGDWFGFNNRDWPMYGLNQDTLMLNMVRVEIARSKDSLYHVSVVRFSQGNNPESALRSAEKIKFDLEQRDSILMLPQGFAISQNDKFRYQRVWVMVEVPVGKRIEMDRSLHNYKSFRIDLDRYGGWNDRMWDDNWDRTYGWSDNVEYIMTNEGLKSTRQQNAAEEEANPQTRQKTPALKEARPGREEKSNSKNDYRYKGNDSSKQTNPDSSSDEKENLKSDPTAETQTYPSIIYMLTRISR